MHRVATAAHLRVCIYDNSTALTTRLPSTKSVHAGKHIQPDTPSQKRQSPTLK